MFISYISDGLVSEHDIVGYSSLVKNHPLQSVISSRPIHHVRHKGPFTYYVSHQGGGGVGPLNFWLVLLTSLTRLGVGVWTTPIFLLT